MKTLCSRLMFATLLLIVVSPVMAQRLAYSGLDPSQHQDEVKAIDFARNLATTTGGSANPSIAYVNTSDVVGLLTAAGFTNLTEIPVDDLDTTDLSGFDLLWVGRTDDGEAAALTAAEANVQAYFAGGGNIVAEDQRATVDSYDWLPFGDDLGPVTSDEDTITIVLPDHPTMAGLTSGDLSGWGNSHHKIFTTPETDGFLTVATGFEDNATVIVRGEFGIIKTTPVPLLNNYGSLFLILLLASLGGFAYFRKSHA